MARLLMDTTLGDPGYGKRSPTEIMRTFVLVLLLMFVTCASAGDPNSRVVVYLIDPRNVPHTENTMRTEYRDDITDVIGSRTLTGSEMRTLMGMLKRELVDDDNIPFCGHRPAYAVQMVLTNNKPTTVTLCGICGTWARDGKVRGLGGKRSLNYLERLLPLPDFLKSVKRGPDLDDLGDEPFYLMEAEK